MKRLLYLISVVVFAAGLSSCNKESDPEPIPVVGKWEADRIRVSGLPTAYAASNGQEFDAYDFLGLRLNFEIKADKTFKGTDRSLGSPVTDFDGTWEYSGTKLSLKFKDGNEETLEYDSSKEQLLGEAGAVQDSLINPTTKKAELVKFNLQLIYGKP